MASISAMEMIVTATGDGSSIQFIQTGTEIISFQKMNRKTVPSAGKACIPFFCRSLYFRNAVLATLFIGNVIPCST